MSYVYILLLHWSQWYNSSQKKKSGLPLWLQEKVAQKLGGFYRTCVLNGFLMTAHNVCLEGMDAQESCNPASRRVSRCQFHVQTGRNTLHSFSYYMHLFQRNKFRHTYLCDYQHIPIKLTNY